MKITDAKAEEKYSRLETEEGEPGKCWKAKSLFLMWRKKVSLSSCFEI